MQGVKLVKTQDKSLTVEWLDGRMAQFPYFWLRDHCREPESLNQDTLQREVDTFSIPEDIRAETATLSGDGSKIAVTWAHDGFVSGYEAAFLREMAFGPEGRVKRKLWRSGDIQEDLPEYDFADIQAGDKGLLSMLEGVEKYGFAVINGLPTNVDATRDFITRIAYIRETIFGGLWDFSANMAHSDTAYTTADIGPHTDGTYSFDSPGLQLLHCLAFDGEGGISVFADGFKIAETIREEDPEAFRILTEVAVPGHYLEEGVHLIARHRIINLDDDGELEQICFNNFDRAPFLLDEARMMQFYSALRRFHDLAYDPAMQVRFQLVPGKAVLFDNWRVLHARTAYTGFRHLAGGYVNREDFESRLRVLRKA